ncbi:MAG: hypothetical protein ACI8RZ_003901 [Myxococcota bacterium]|jgi:hypothetical protein
MLNRSDVLVFSGAFGFAVFQIALWWIPALA